MLIFKIWQTASMLFALTGPQSGALLVEAQQAAHETRDADQRLELVKSYAALCVWQLSLLYVCKFISVIALM